MRIFTICCNATGCYAQGSSENIGDLQEFVSEHDHGYYSIYREES